MPTSSPQTMKLKSTLRLLIPRLRMAQKKDTAVSIASRREMAQLLEQNREASARIRVENIIQTDITVELMEILELYAELLLARAGLLDSRDKNESLSDTGLEEAAASIIYAAPRFPREIKELAIVRAMLIERWGKDFALKCQENRDNVVPKRVADKLKVEPPSEKLVTAYLEEIARTYGVDWPNRPPGEDEALDQLQDEVDAEEGDEEKDADDKGNSDDGDGGGEKAPAAATTTPKSKKKVDLGRPFEREELSRATPPRDISSNPGARSPISVAPPGARTDNLHPKLKLPGGEEVAKKQPEVKPAPATAKPTAAAPKNIVGGKIPDVDELAKRFSALKR